MNKQTYQIQSKTISRCRCTLEALEPVQGTRDRQVGCICKALSSRVLMARATARPKGCRTHVGIATGTGRWSLRDRTHALPTRRIRSAKPQSTPPSLQSSSRRYALSTPLVPGHDLTDTLLTWSTSGAYAHLHLSQRPIIFPEQASPFTVGPFDVCLLVSYKIR
jgi:hypothetical protein